MSTCLRRAASQVSATAKIRLLRRDRGFTITSSPLLLQLQRETVSDAEKEQVRARDLRLGFLQGAVRMAADVAVIPNINHLPPAKKGWNLALLLRVGAVWHTLAQSDRKREKARKKSAFNDYIYYAVIKCHPGGAHEIK
jgi:hypothetical protein